MIKSCHSFLHGLLMPDLSELDARATLQQPLLCTDAGDWQTSTEQPGAFRICSGLTTRQGLPTKLTVDLRLRKGAKTCTLQFTVLAHDAMGSYRVYQLEINQSRQQIKNRHARSHEHVGSRRFEGPEQWHDWEFDEVFLYFCGQTNIQFQPSPQAPVKLPGRKKR
jgi:hypothetical protein